MDNNSFCVYERRVVENIKTFFKYEAKCLHSKEDKEFWLNIIGPYFPEDSDDYRIKSS